MKIAKSKSKSQKIKTTILIDKTLKKLAQVYGIQNDMTLGEVIEEALEQKIVGK